MIKLARNSSVVPDISIVCIAYNQAELVKNALKGFISQKFTLNYEIVIHDDASTDDTPEVLKQFYHENSDKVTLLLQTENQNSKPDVDVTCCGISHAQGKYIALCEGDDYWIDELKLQKQYDALESNQAASSCFHTAFTETPDGTRALFAHHSEETVFYTTEDVIIGDGAFMPTSALFFRKSAFERMSQDLIENMPCGDYFFQVIASSDGGSIYLPEPMSVYRIGHPGSFTTNFSSSDWEKRAIFYRKMKVSLKILNSLTEGKFTHSFNIMNKKFSKIYRKSVRRAWKAKIKSSFSF